MKGKKYLIILQAVLAAVLIVIYFIPKPLDSLAFEGGDISLKIGNCELKESGEPEFGEVTGDFAGESESCEKLTALLRKYSYRRTLRTPFGKKKVDYDMVNNCEMYFFTPSRNRVRRIHMTGSGELMIDGYSYHMGAFGKKKQLEFLDELRGLLEDE